jgi:hypothetical protein
MRKTLNAFRVKITDVRQILNFRFDTRYLDGVIRPHGGVNLSVFRDETFPVVNRQRAVEILSAFPSVFNQFKHVFFSIRLEHVSYHVNQNVTTDNVYCNPYAIDMLIDMIESNNFDLKTRPILVIAGDDQHLSQVIDRLNRIRCYFKQIYYEAKDIECDWIQTIPMGHTMGYMLRNGGDEALHHINKKKHKTKLIASAFGSVYPGLLDSISNRRHLKEFTERNEFVDNMFCEPLSYYEQLCKYQFFTCPLGNGLQTPKICESIMCETVPVVTDHVVHRELRDRYDLPLLIVKQWADITEQFLNEQWDATYCDVDWPEKKNKLLVNNFEKLLI